MFDGFNERVWVAKHRAAASPQPPYAAMAAAWNKRGGFTIALAKDINDARQRSLSVCNEKNGDCALAHAAQPSSFACMTLARNPQDQTKLYPCIGFDLRYLAHERRGELQQGLGQILSARVFGMQ